MTGRQITVAEAMEVGYTLARELPSGKTAGIRSMFATVGLFVGLDHWGYDLRYCYEHAADAILALAVWDGAGDPPGPWIKKKGSGFDELNPRLADDDFGEAAVVARSLRA